MKCFFSQLRTSPQDVETNLQSGSHITEHKYSHEILNKTNSLQRPPMDVHNLLLASFLESPELVVPSKSQLSAQPPYKTYGFNSWTNTVYVESNPERGAASLRRGSNGISGYDDWPNIIWSALIDIPGSDLVLMDTALECLRSAGRPTSVFSGSTMFVESKLKGSL